MGLFSRKTKRETTRHSAGVIYAYGDEIAYYSVVCNCGFFVEPVDSEYPNPAVEAQMVRAALEHDPFAETAVFFPVKKPPAL